ncbi:hypothetical protein FRC11_011826, partial [Ceratobasidium sp. 423]
MGCKIFRAMDPCPASTYQARGAAKAWVIDIVHTYLFSLITIPLPTPSQLLQTTPDDLDIMQPFTTIMQAHGI